MKTPHNELFYHESLFFYLVFICWRKCRERSQKQKKIKKIKNKEKKNQALVDFKPLFPDMSWMKLSFFCNFSNWCALVRISLSFDCYMLLYFSRQAGHRVGEHLERIIPMIVQYSRVENDDELREYCIQVRVDSFFELPACKTASFTCAVMFYSKSTTCISELLVKL